MTTTKHVRTRAHVYVKLEPTDDLKLCVNSIQISDSPRLREDVFSLVFEWFSMTGNTNKHARQNCIDSIAFYVHCRPELRNAIINALDVECAVDVTAAEAKL